jgi:hypothetical protein
MQQTEPLHVLKTERLLDLLAIRRLTKAARWIGLVMFANTLTGIRLKARTVSTLKRTYSGKIAAIKGEKHAD